MEATPSTATLIADLIERFGLPVVVLGAIVWAFMKGKVWPKEQVDVCLKAQHDAGVSTAEVIGEKLATAMKDGVREATKEGISVGIAEGYIKIVEIQKNGGRNPPGA